MAVETLRSGLKDGDRDYRRLCAYALWRVGPNARPATMDLLETLRDSNVHDKIMVCQALGSIGVDDSTATAVETGLVGALRSDDTNLKIAAIEALSGLNDPAKDAAPSLIRLLDSPIEPLRTKSLRALARIGHLPREARPKIAEFLNSKDDGTRAGAAIALLRINPDDELAKKTAIACLAPDMPQTTRSSTVFLILGMHREAVIFREELMRLTNDNYQAVAMWSRRTLKEIGESSDSVRK